MADVQLEADTKKEIGKSNIQSKQNSVFSRLYSVIQGCKVFLIHQVKLREHVHA